MGQESRKTKQNTGGSLNATPWTMLPNETLKDILCRKETILKYRNRAD